MSDINRVASNLQKIMSESDKKKTTPYDTQAVVTRVEGGTAWVQFPGSDSDTPVRRVTNANIGDSVQVRVSRGRAWLIGNSTNPPTDDTRANQAYQVGSEAGAIANVAINEANRARSAADNAEAEALRAHAAADEAEAKVAVVEQNVATLNTRVSTAEDNITTIEGNISGLTTRVSTAEGNITTIEGDISSLDTRVDTAEGNITTIEGDISGLTTRVSTAESNITTIEGDISSLDTRVDSAEGNITTIEGDISGLTTRVSTAEGNITTIEGDISSLDTRVDSAEGNITTIEGDISSLDTRVDSAEGNITTVEGNISSLQTRVAEAEDDLADTKTLVNEAKRDAAAAHTAANSALTELSTVEDVVGTVTWAAEHSGQDMADYINSHLALTTYGLDLVLDNTSYRIHIGTHTASGDDGVYVIDDQGHVVSFFGEDIKFDSDHAQYIGNNNAYIVFDPTGNGGQGSLIIGGSSIQMGNRSLEDILGNTLIYDHTYEYVVNSSGKKTGATFTAFLYRGGIDVKSEYDPTCFSWYVKKEDTDGQTKETLLGTGYTITVSLSSCGYGAEIIGKCTIADDADALTNNGDNLTNSDGDNLSVRATGESIRVRDLTTSTVIFPSEQIMIVGASDEHLVSVQTLQDYLNEHLDKQVLFDTTANWNSQTTLVSDASKLYIYTDYKYDSQGNAIAGIKAGDGNAFVCDLPFVDAIATEHIANNTVHITANERTFWNNKVRCYYAGTEQLIFTTA